MEAKRRVPQACEACKLRKVKCNGEQRCQQCTHLDLKCIYPQPKPKASRRQQQRGRVISQYRQQTAPANHVRNPPTSHPGSGASGQPDASPSGSDTTDSPHTFAVPVQPPIPRPAIHHRWPSAPDVLSPSAFAASPANTTSTPGSTQYEASYFNVPFFLDLLSDYEESVYPPNPIILASDVADKIHRMDHDLDQESLAFVYAFAGVTLNLTFIGPKHTRDISKRITSLITEAIRLRGPVFPGQPISIQRIMISFFLHNCLMTLRDKDTAFYYMREAIALIQTLKIDDPEEMSKMSLSDRAVRQRLHWLAFIQERYMCVLDYRPATMPLLATLPEPDTMIPSNIQEYFIQIIRLFRLMDEEFLHNWLDTGNHHSVSTITSSWIEAKTRELDLSAFDPVRDSIQQAMSSPANGDYSYHHHSSGWSLLNTMQQADLLITRHWMQTLIWRMALSKALLHTDEDDQNLQDPSSPLVSHPSPLSLLLPVRLSQQLRHLASTISKEAIEVHGSGIVQKLFELTDTIADVVIHIPAATQTETKQRVHDFLFLLEFVFTFPNLDETRARILKGKLERLRELFPTLCGNVNTPVAAGNDGV
ncbi:hypothetical protein K402DRAFT_399653 [Aulographum hederae CBS 113979]|uniref:Zn(2)-C6 fungal-type domain-containing protein n=1 Tax=Aulographum hederae CBS 113979 TaxID=1176131 RepID=A0A6G1HHA9_9PEZI|nr:hypothetical protein K402DRAFT_399653 [Aulographum hederae CBS 113979]